MNRTVFVLRVLSVLLGVGILFLSVLVTQNAVQAKRKVTVSLSEVPEAVRNTIQRELGAASIESIKSSTKKSGVVYDVKAEDGTKKIDLEIAANGKLRERDIEEKIAVKDVASEIVRAIKRVLPETTITKARRETKLDDEDVKYVLKLTLGARKLSAQVKVDGDRKLDGSVREKTPVSELPGKVVEAYKKTIPKTGPGTAEKRISLDWDRLGDVTYRWGNGKSKRNVSITADGTTIREELKLGELPEPVLDALKKRFDGYRIKDLEKVTVNGQERYDADAESNTDEYKIRATPTGGIEYARK